MVRRCSSSRAATRITTAGLSGEPVQIHVGCKTAIALRDAGFEAKYMKGGHSAWKAIGGPIKLYT